MCLYPRLIRNRKYTVTKKNNGEVPVASDARVLLVPIGCGKCMECMKQKATQWKVRLNEEVRNDTSGKFITLTFEDKYIIEINEAIKKEGLKGYEIDNGIATYAMRHFLERWRKKHKKSVKHWFITELGQTSTERIHMHGILWTKETNENISKLWKYGGISVGKRLYLNGKQMNENETGYVNEKTVNYISKYITKRDLLHKEYKSKIMCSAGIGSGYLNRKDCLTNEYKENEETDQTYKTRNGYKLALPIYYRNKLYSEEEREKLWIEMLDKNKRYVLGEEIDISEGDEEYFETLRQARIKNKKLKFGDDSINWERKKYENERRNLKMQERLNNTTAYADGKGEEITNNIIKKGKSRRRKYH